MKVGKFATETLEMLCETFGEYSLSQIAVLYGIHISKLIECQLKMNVAG
jgi:hypothetical protein